jgi:hypothetical protein
VVKLLALSLAFEWDRFWLFGKEPPFHPRLESSSRIFLASKVKQRQRRRESERENIREQMRDKVSKLSSTRQLLWLWLCE